MKQQQLDYIFYYNMPTAQLHVQYESKKSPVSVPVPFRYGKRGDFFHPVFPVPFRCLARFRAHVYKFYISRDRPIEREASAEF